MFKIDKLFVWCRDLQEEMVLVAWKVVLDHLGYQWVRIFVLQVAFHDNSEETAIHMFWYLPYFPGPFYGILVLNFPLLSFAVTMLWSK